MVVISIRIGYVAFNKRLGSNLIYNLSYYALVRQEGSNDGKVITLTESGVILTADKTELACIHARDHSTGRSEIAACVRVAEVCVFRVPDFGMLA